MIGFLYFILAASISFFIPGDIVISKLKLSLFHRATLATCVGMVLWALQGFVFGFLGHRELTYLYLALCVLLWVWMQRDVRIRLSLLGKKNAVDFLLIFIIAVGTAIQLLTIWFIGVRVHEGLLFCCFWPDAFYHLGLTSQLVAHMPPIEPGISGVTVRNYHYLANLINADLIRIFGFELMSLQYRYMGFLISLLLGCSAAVFAQVTGVGKSFTRWLVFFLYFSGDIIFILLFFMGHGINFSQNVSENATTLWFSPPRVYAMVVFFAGISFITLWVKEKRLLSGLIASVLLASLMGFKVYIGILGLVGLGFLTLSFLVKRKLRMIIPSLVAGTIALTLYLPINSGAGGLFFVGLWRIEDFAVHPIFGLIRFELARQVYLVHQNYVKVFLIETIYFVLYMYSLCGMFLVGFFQTRQSLKKLGTHLNIFLLSGLLVSFIIGMLFLQQTGGANTLQFLFSVYIVGSIYAALACWYWVAKVSYPKKVFVIILLLLLIGGRVTREVHANISHLLTREGAFLVSNEELAALTYLRTKTEKDALVLIQPDTKKENDCYYMSFLSERQLFLCGQGILRDHGAHPDERLQRALSFFSQHSTDIQSLNTHGISYIYVPRDVQFPASTSPFLQQVFHNTKITIYHVKKS